jgi:hypothetical protein
MKTDDRSVQNSTLTEFCWLAGAVGTAAAVATLVYSRRTPSRWDRARSSLRPLLGMLASAAGMVSAARSAKSSLQSRLRHA